MTKKKTTPVRPSGGRRYASIPEAAEYLAVHPVTIRKMIADGRLRAYRSGTALIRVDLNELDAVMTGEGRRMTGPPKKERSPSDQLGHRHPLVVTDDHSQRRLQSNWGAS